MPTVGAGRKSLEVILGIYESAKTGSELPLPRRGKSLKTHSKCWANFDKPDSAIQISDGAFFLAFARMQ